MVEIEEKILMSKKKKVDEIDVTARSYKLLKTLKANKKIISNAACTCGVYKTYFLLKLVYISNALTYRLPDDYE